MLPAPERASNVTAPPFRPLPLASCQRTTSSMHAPPHLRLTSSIVFIKPQTSHQYPCGEQQVFGIDGGRSLPLYPSYLSSAFPHTPVVIIALKFHYHYAVMSCSGHAMPCNSVVMPCDMP